MEGDIRPKRNALIIGVNLYTEMVAVGGHVTIIVNRVYTRNLFGPFITRTFSLTSLHTVCKKNSKHYRDNFRMNFAQFITKHRRNYHFCFRSGVGRCMVA